jgi:hypothetical protein
MQNTLQQQIDFLKSESEFWQAIIQSAIDHSERTGRAFLTANAINETKAYKHMQLYKDAIDSLYALQILQNIDTKIE